MRVLIIFCMYLLTCGYSIAQVEFTAQATRDKIAVNERVRIDFKMNVDGDNFTPPNFEGFKVVSGPMQSFSQQWINGKGSMSKSYSYVIQPNKTGNITINQAVMQHDGETYKTTPISINVGPAVQQPKDADSKEITPESGIHLVAEVSNPKPYLNQPIKVVYKLYVANNTGVRGWNEVASPKYPDFWSLNIDNPNAQVKNGTYQGKPYRYLELREVVLYPQKTGKLTIEPLTLDINIQVPTSKRDFFGRPLMTTETTTVSAGSRTINVKSVPMQGRPASYTGAVGNFKFDVSVDKAQLEAGESLNATVEVSGTGNLKLMDLPKLKAPSSLEVYDPERRNDIKTSSTGMRGSISDTYVIVPQFGGKYLLPAIEFSYFDPYKEQFVTIDSGETLIDVKGTAPITTNDSLVNNPTNDINYISNNKPFAFIKTSTKFGPKQYKYFFNSVSYWLLLSGTLLLIPITLLIRRRQQVIANDITGNRIKKANKLSRKYLSNAKKNLGNHEAFYVSLEKSLHHYLKSKLRIQTTDMSKDHINNLLINKGVNTTVINDFISLLSSCEFARYTPSSESTMQQDYQQASQVINLMDKELKN